MSSVSDTATLDTFPELATRRLILRELRPADAESAYRFYSDPVTMRFYDTVVPALEDVREMFAMHRRRCENDEAVRWGITLKGEDQVVGTCGFWRVSPGLGEISYVLARPYWNQGIMAEALRAIMRFGFDHYRLHRLEAHVVVLNPASLRLLQKLGFREEGHLRERFLENDRYYDEKLLALLKHELVQ